MRTILNFFLLTAGIAGFLAACDKAETLPLHGSGTTSVLSASSTNVAPAPIDSNKIALTLNWTSPLYATDTTNYKFVIEIDSTGKNFAKADTRTVMGQLTTSFIAKELNTLLLNRGYAFNVPVDMDVRLKASYGNNNELKLSNVVKIKMTPYKVPPKVALPASLKLFIVGNGTAGGDATGCAPATPWISSLRRLFSHWSGCRLLNSSPPPWATGIMWSISQP